MAEEDKSAVEEPRKQRHRGIKAMPYIIGNETFEKLGTIGSSANLMVYLTTVFNLKRVYAASLINVWNGTSHLTPLIGAFVSDAYLGRYKTLGYACLTTLTGLFLMVLTSGVPDLHPPNCAGTDGEVCKGPTPWQMAFLLLALGILVVGAGGIRSCNLAFGADQFDQTTDSGRRGVNSFFNWYFFSFTFAMMMALTLIVWVQSNVSWTLGLGIPALLMMLSCIIFFVGTGIYVKVKPEGSPFSSIAQVLVAAFKKRRLKLKAQGSEDGKLSCLFDPPHTSSLVTKLSHTDQFRYLDKGAIVGEEDEIRPDGSPANPWRLCRVQQVEEVKCILRVIPIWAAGIIFNVGVIQQTTYVVVQALQSDRRIGKSFSIPAASFSVFTMLSLTLWIPVYDRLVVPAIRKLTGKEGGITLLQRMGIGLFLSLFTMIVSAQVEQRRRGIALHHPTLGFAKGGGAVSAMSGFWLIPQLTLAGLSEAFTSVAQFEFYYKQFPENMRSVAGSLFFLGVSASNYLSGFLVSTIHRATEDGGNGGWLSEDLNKGMLERFYYTIAGLGFLNFVYFLLCSSWYRYKVASSTAIEEAAMEPTKSKSPPV